MITREFYTLLYDAIEHMKVFTELSSKRIKLEKKISNAIDCQLISNITMDDDVSKLLILDNQDVLYLCNFLLLGYLVQEGKSMSEAYGMTISKFDNSFERIVSKSLMNMKYFRKLNNTEYELIKSLKEVLTNKN